MRSAAAFPHLNQLANNFYAPPRDMLLCRFLRPIRAALASLGAHCRDETHLNILGIHRPHKSPLVLFLELFLGRNSGIPFFLQFLENIVLNIYLALLLYWALKGMVKWISIGSIALIAVFVKFFFIHLSPLINLKAIHIMAAQNFKGY